MSDEDTSPTSEPPLIRKRSSGEFLGEEQNDDDKPMVFPDFDVFPEFLRIGPWSPFAYAYLAFMTLALLATAMEAFRTFPTFEGEEAMDWNKWAGFGILAFYCTAINFYVMKRYGPMPFVSYTMIAYTLLNLRLVCVFLGLKNISELLRFPVLVMAWVTTTVWWLVLVPILLFFIPGGRDERRKFVEFNFSFFLINVHLINLPIAMLDHMSTWRPLVLTDLWVGLVTALAYLLFYLNALDKNGIHFYIILSPRPWWCVFVYTLLLAIYAGVHHALG